MTNTPRFLSDSALLTRAQTLAAEERRVELEFLLHLREIERRDLHLARGFVSIFDYLTRELKYSEGAAYRRLESMRALRDLPELGPAIESGAVNLTTVAQVQSFLKTEKPGYTTEQKRELFEQIQHKSKREVEQVLAEISPNYSSQPTEKTRVVAADQTQITFVADAELMALARARAYPKSYFSSEPVPAVTPDPPPPPTGDLAARRGSVHVPRSRNGARLRLPVPSTDGSSAAMVTRRDEHDRQS